MYVHTQAATAASKLARLKCPFHGRESEADTLVVSDERQSVVQVLSDYLEGVVGLKQELAEDELPQDFLDSALHEAELKLNTVHGIPSDPSLLLLFLVESDLCISCLAAKFCTLVLPQEQQFLMCQMLLDQKAKSMLSSFHIVPAVIF